MITLYLQIIFVFYFKYLVHKVRFFKYKKKSGASLVMQWLRIRLPMQGACVWALLREDPTCRGATGPVHHSCWACALEPASHSCWSLCTWSPCSATREAMAMRGPRTATRSGPTRCNWRGPARRAKTQRSQKWNKFFKK